MKKNLFFAAVCIIASFALLFTVLTTNATSLQDLRAKADASTYCAPNSGTDCRSHATGNIYPNYTAKPYDVELPIEP